MLVIQIVCFDHRSPRMCHVLGRNRHQADHLLLHLKFIALFVNRQLSGNAL